MKNSFITVFLILFYTVYAQNVGINTANPTAALDISSKSNINSTNALNINNSSSQNLLKITNQGNAGINLAGGTPTSLLQINSESSTNIKHENLPVLSSPDFTAPFSTLGISTNGNEIGKGGIIKYMYYQNSSTYPSTYNFTTNTGGFSLFSTNQYTNLPIFNNSDLKGNTLGLTFGNDAAGTVNGQNVSNIGYIIIPDPGVYLFEFYGTARCNRYNNTQNYTFSGQLQVNTIFATATGNTYTTNTIVRGLMQGMRNDSGVPGTTAYSIANPQVLTVALQTTQANQKVALFFQYASGEANQLTNNECYFNVPAGSNFSYYLIVTKM